MRNKFSQVCPKKTTKPC